MRLGLAHNLGRVKDFSSSMWARFAKPFCCRECGREVRFFADICQFCGAGSPVKVRVSPTLLATLVAAQVYFILRCAT